MCRGFLASCRYSFNCWSVSFRPNHVFHQNKKGIRQISHAVRKKRSFWVRDVPRFAGEERGSSVSIIYLQPQTGAVVVPCGRTRPEPIVLTATIIPPRPHPSRDLAPDNAKLRTAPEAASGAEFRRRSILPWHEAHSGRGYSARRCQTADRSPHFGSDQTA